jgi:hypothetical protein
MAIFMQRWIKTQCLHMLNAAEYTIGIKVIYENNIIVNH